jgi:hypothetical protein
VAVVSINAEPVAWSEKVAMWREQTGRRPCQAPSDRQGLDPQSLVYGVLVKTA